MSKFVNLVKDDRGVATVTLSRAEKRNAFDDLMISQMQELFSQLADDTFIRVVILAAEGKCFSAGADLNWMRRMAAYDYHDNLRDARVLAELLKILNNMPQPTIARVQGAAFGGAVGLISCCDMAYAAETASFCLSEVKLGLVPAVISPYVVAAIGQRVSRRYFQTAEVFSAMQALNLGLLTEVLEDSELDDAIAVCVNRLLENGPLAMHAAKTLVAKVADQPVDEEILHYTSDLIATLRVSEEGQEGLGAFFEKRQPKWRGA